MKPVRYHPEARAELIESALFYDDRQPGVGGRFLKAVEECEQRARVHPASGTPSEPETRQRRVAKFPFALVYREYSDHLFVVAVAHLSRKPGYWENRIEPSWVDDV
ncbi:MAG: type II toxin-antitoxin system RelE/ParE family toxin [Armatimonadetes bacterium]|nr:type II toxin-antitoxin system RelE/ParE family toxin [Armatimonadota bacterium]